MAICLLGLNNHILWDYHEPYVGGIIREMATSGDWIVPTLNGQPYLEKPPLYYVLGALACRGFGTFDPWVLRLPAALFSIIAAMWAFFLGRRVASLRAGVWAGSLVSTTALFFLEGHTAVVDMALTAAMSISFGLAYLAIVEPAHRVRWVGLFWASLGFAFLAKGVFGPVMVILPLAIVLVIHRDRELAVDLLRPNWGMAAAIGLAALWIIPLALRGGGEFLTEVFIRNSVGRFLASPSLVPRTGALGEHVEPLYFYLARTPGNLLPWLVIWLAAMGGSFFGSRGRAALLAQHFFPVVFLVYLALLSVSAEKRMVYLLPAIPVTCVQTALWLDRRLPGVHDRVPRGMMGVVGGTAVLVGLLGAAFPWVVVSRVHMPLRLATGMTMGSLLLTGISGVLLWRRCLTALVDWLFVHWIAFLVAFLLIAVPWLDTGWRPILEPFQVAHALEGQGARVMEGWLSETQLGYASLELRHTLPSLDSRQSFLKALASPEPVAVLMEPKSYKRMASDSFEVISPGVEYPTEASGLAKLWDRTPVLLLNPPALDRLRHTPFANRAAGITEIGKQHI